MIKLKNGLYDVFSLWLAALMLTCVVGCGTKQPDRKLVRVRGTVRVNGQPTPGITVMLHPDDGRPAISQGISGADGGFEISTYSAGDGALPGHYGVTCVWSDYDPITRDYTGDRLGGGYADPSDTPIQWDLQPDHPDEERLIDLATK